MLPHSYLKGPNRPNLMKKWLKSPNSFFKAIFEEKKLYMGMFSYSKLGITHAASIPSYLSFNYDNFFKPRMIKNEPKVAKYDFIACFICPEVDL